MAPKYGRISISKKTKKPRKIKALRLLLRRRNRTKKEKKMRRLWKEISEWIQAYRIRKNAAQIVIWNFNKIQMEGREKGSFYLTKKERKSLEELRAIDRKIAILNGRKRESRS